MKLQNTPTRRDEVPWEKHYYWALSIWEQQWAKIVGSDTMPYLSLDLHIQLAIGGLVH